MDRYSRKVFKYIFKNNKNVTLDILKDNFSNMPSVIESYLTLIDEKLIINRKGSIELTNKGKDYYHDKVLKIIKLLITSIIIPIIVAYLTTLFTSNNNQSSNDTNNNWNNKINNKSNY